jgi:hypothetical protein
MIAIWDTVPCRLFRGAYCLYHQGDEMMMEAVCTSMRLHSTVSQKAIIFILAAVRT